MEIDLNKFKKFLNENKSMLNSIENIINTENKVHSFIESIDYKKFDKNTTNLSKSFKEIEKEFTYTNKIISGFSKSIKKPYQSLFHPSVVLVSYPLPGRQSISLASSFDPHTKCVYVYISYMARCYKIGSMIGDQFVTNEFTNIEESLISHYLLAKTVMSHKIVQDCEGPTYEEIRHDYFWVRFLMETEQLGAIALVDAL